MSMNQYDWGTLDASTEDGTELATALNAWVAAVLSMHRGNDVPSYAVAGMIWPKSVSSTVEQLYYYDGANSILLATVNPTAHTVSFSRDALPAADAGNAGAVVLADTTDVLTGSNATDAVTADALAALWEDGGNVSAISAGVVTLGEGGSFNLITSTAAITKFVFATAKTGRRARLRFNTVRQLTNGPDLSLPGGANITTAVGDTCEVEDRGGGTARINEYTKADGTALVSSKTVPVRQTVLASSQNSGGIANFTGIGTGLNATIAASTTPIVLTAANGFGASGPVDRIGVIPADTTIAVTDNATNFLYADIAADGTCTLGSTTLAPVYQFGGTYSTTNGQFTFNIQDMVGKVGNGATAAQAYRVFLGEAVASGGSVISNLTYALMGRYLSTFTQNLPGTSTSVSFTHQIGISTLLGSPSLILECTTTDNGYAVGDQLRNPCTNSGGAETPLVPALTGRNTMQIQTGVTAGAAAIPKGGGGITNLTQNSWKYAAMIDRGW